jgi:hypothetical protein
VSYQRLAELARREERLVADEQWDELFLLQAECADAIAALPSKAGQAELPMLELALRCSRATERALGLELARIGSQLAAIGQGRRAALAYGGEPDARLDARA